LKKGFFGHSYSVVLGKAQFNLRKCQPSGQMSFLLHSKTNMCNGPEFAGLFSNGYSLKMVLRNQFISIIIEILLKFMFFKKATKNG
jgi:hypothetical protein